MPDATPRDRLWRRWQFLRETARYSQAYWQAVAALVIWDDGHG